MAHRQSRNPRPVTLSDFPREASDIDEHARKMRDPSYADDLNLIHTIHYLMGYRSVVVWGRDADCPFSSGSAQAISWHQGAEQARLDLAHPCKVA